MTHIPLVHVCRPALMYQFGCDSDLVLVIKKPVVFFSGMWDPQEPYSDRNKTDCEKANF